MLRWLHQRLRADSGVASSRPSSVTDDDGAQSLLLDGLGSLPSEFLEPSQSEEQRYILRRVRDNPMWTLDRGTGYYQQQRLSKKKASLLGSGRDSGKSKVMYHGIEWTRMLRHVWKRDFFTTAVHARFQYIVAAMIGVFVSTFLAWAVVYYAIWLVHPHCFLGFRSFLSAFLFSIETQNTIGYGSHAIGDCWLPAWLVGLQCILAVLLEAIFIGIIFAKISHPKGRSRTILISECACIARRDGIVKFMFRVADIRKRTAIAPRIAAHLYTWGLGHTTAEGEHIPVQVQPLPLHYLDPTLLLPVVVEHTIDERSPLYGHTSSSLEALSAEIVVTFEGQSELGDSFMTRQSYLPSEVHWGCRFVNIISQAKAGSMQHSIDLSRFHDVEPQAGLALMPPQRLARAVVLGGSRRVPRARLGENTLLLADELVVTQTPDGAWFVAVRVGDAYPSQMCSAGVRMYIYRYSNPSAAAGSHTQQHHRPGASGAAAAGPDASAAAAAGQQQTYVHQELPLTRHLWHVTPGAGGGGGGGCGSGGGVDVLLRYPVVVGHEIGPDSPLHEWVTHEGMLKDADAEIVVVASATQYVSSHLAMRSKVYSVLGSIRWGYSYAACVVPPHKSPTGHCLVNWSRFHDVLAAHPAARPRGSSRRGTATGGTGLSPRGSLLSGGLARGGAAGSEGICAAASNAWSDGCSVAEATDEQAGGQQQQPAWQAAPDTFEAQLAEAHSLESCSWQEQQQQRRPGSGTGFSRAGSSRLSSVVVHGGSGGSGSLQQHGDAAAAAVAAAGAGAGAAPQDCCSRLGRRSSGGTDGAGSLVHAHSLGFSHFHDMSELHTRLQAQQQQQSAQGQQQQQEQWQQRERGGDGALRQGISSAAQLYQAAQDGGGASRRGEPAGGGGGLAAGSSSRHDGPDASGSGSEAEQPDAAALAALRYAVGGGGSVLPQAVDRSQHQQHDWGDSEADHTLTMIPRKPDSWAGKRSLASVLFEAASPPAPGDDDAGGNPAAQP